MLSIACKNHINYSLHFICELFQKKTVSLLWTVPLTGEAKRLCATLKILSLQWRRGNDKIEGHVDQFCLSLVFVIPDKKKLVKDLQDSLCKCHLLFTL